MKTALITGGSRGIGKAIVEKFQAEGYVVNAPSRTQLDLSCPNSIKNYISCNPNGFDVIVNNAGCNEIDLIENYKDEELDKMINLNLVAPLKLLRGFIPAMKQKQSGKIINIGSIWSVVSKPGRGAYSATKNAIHGITNTLALELAEYNILVNTVCPGFTATELTYQNNTHEEIRKIISTVPVNRMAQPNEIAEAVFFFASEKNTYITGQKIIIDGGFTIA